MVERLVQIARRVQYVGRDYQVVTVGLEALIHRVLLDVKHSVVERGAPGAEARLRVRKEARGDVGVHVLEPSRRQLRHDALGRRSNAGTDLQHAKRPILRQLVQERSNGLAQHPVRRPPDRSTPIEIASLRLRISEQQRQRILVSAEHLGQGTGTAPKQPHLVRRVREPLRQLRQKRLAIGRHPVRQRIVRSDRYSEDVVLCPQHAGASQHFEDSAEQLRVLG